MLAQRSNILGAFGPSLTSLERRRSSRSIKPGIKSSNNSTRFLLLPLVIAFTGGSREGARPYFEEMGFVSLLFILFRILVTYNNLSFPYLGLSAWLKRRRLPHWCDRCHRACYRREDEGQDIHSYHTRRICGGIPGERPRQAEYG